MQEKFSAPIETVYAALTDPKFLEERCLELGEISASCKVKKSAGGHTVTMKRQVKRELPGFLSKLFNPVQTIVIEEKWSDDDDGGMQASYRLEVIGQPVEVSATISLRPSGKGCVYEISHRAKARIPLIGGQVERFVLGQTEAGCKDELVYTAKAVKADAKKAPAAKAPAAKAPAAKKASTKK
ncbi:MAG: DUF2505 family protein [Burkholderiaceae bacterium]|nr:DUF2505 family protein [Burkholderiaceae bacterium]